MSLLLPNYERYEQGSQLRRASKSIAACIAEGYGRRQYKAEFVKFVIYAHASCDETVVHLNFLVDTHDLDPVPVKQLIRSYEELGSRIHNFIKYVDKEWRKQETISE